MPPKAESRLVTRLMRELRIRGAVAERLHGSKMQRRGLPDVIVVSGSLSPAAPTFWLEAKMPGEQLRPDQEQVIAEIRRAGGLVAVVESVNDLEALLDEIAERADGGVHHNVALLTTP